MSFGDDIRRFQERVETRRQDVFVGVATEAHRSVQTGSEITGAPGQPVQTGNLRASWQLRFVDASTAEIATNAVYAPSIEDGISYAHGGTPMTLRSAVGGFHSLALTRAGFQRIVDVVTQRITGGNP